MDRRPVESRLIRALGYDPAASILEVELAGNGRVYRYFDVPFSAYQELVEAESKGHYFNEHVRDFFAYEEDDPPARRDPTPPDPADPTSRDPDPMDWSTAFDAARPYLGFLEAHANPAQRARWDAIHGRVQLSADQAALLGGFVRRMPVLVLAGTWCGDCVNQCPTFDHFAAAAKVIDLRFLDRDARPEVADALAINGGHRVPAVLFLSEDFQEVARHGERTLSTYRRLAAEQLGPACPTGFVPPDGDALAASLADWLNEFERAQLILRLSPRLRMKYQD